MSTSSAIDNGSTLTITGLSEIGFEGDVAAIVAWLREIRPDLFKAG
jgi:hypothetical protein